MAINKTDEILLQIKNDLVLRNIEYAGHSSGGCINEVFTFVTEGRKLFTKLNAKENAHGMFRGEYASLVALQETGTVTVPHPIKIIDHPRSGAIFVMEHIDMTSLSGFQSKLGEQIARLHKSNSDIKMALDDSSLHKKECKAKSISQFGFDIPTFCGQIAQDNTWTQSWTEFFAKKIDFQVQLLENTYGEREVRELWTRLSLQLSSILADTELTPSLLHGDLWAGNAGENDQGPVVYDAACFYGHSEYDLAIAKMFGGFNQEFYSSYHKIIPKTEGFEARNLLYQFFHHLNHWNHFGSSYRRSSISLVKQLLKT